MTDQLKKKNLYNNNLIKGSIVAVLIAISPYIFYIYNSFPEGAKEAELFFITFKTEAYPDLLGKAWYFVQKFVPLSLLILWFITCKHWWYHVILIPIAMYAFQLFSVINEDAKLVDEIEYIYIVPIMMIIIPFVYLIRLKIFDKVIHGIDLREIDEELKEIDDPENISKDNPDLN
jgi:hypothetical protein